MTANVLENAKSCLQAKLHKNIYAKKIIAYFCELLVISHTHTYTSKGKVLRASQQFKVINEQLSASFGQLNIKG